MKTEKGVEWSMKSNGAKSNGVEATAEFGELVNLLAVYSEASNRLQGLEAEVNEQLLEAIDEHKGEYARLQEVLTNAEGALEALARSHPEWFEVKKSLKTPYGTVKFHRGTRLEVENAEATVRLLRAEARSNPAFRAEDYVRQTETPDLEALEELGDDVLERFMVRRVSEDKFSVVPAKLDMGKAVAAAEAKAGGGDDRNH